MDWIQFWLEVVITGVLLYVIQKIFDERASRRLEEFKANLQSAAFEHETRFEKLHERQAEVIAELYKGLVQIQSSLRSFAHAMDSDILSHTKGEEGIATKETIDAFWDYFQEHRIYLPESLGKKIDEFHRQSMLAYIDLFSATISKELSSDDESYQEKYTKELAEAAGILADGISPVRDDIAREFRGLLGS
jgi:hypothetical protein